MTFPNRQPARANTTVFCPVDAAPLGEVPFIAEKRPQITAIWGLSYLSLSQRLSQLVSGTTGSHTVGVMNGAMVSTAMALPGPVDHGLTAPALSRARTRNS